MDEIIGTLIALSPLIFLILVPLLKIDAVVSMEESFGSWILRRLEVARYSDGRINRWFFRPVFFCMTKVREWTEGLKNQHFRAALRFFLYLNIAWMALWVASFVIMTIIAFAIMAFVISIADGDDHRDTDDDDRGNKRRKRKGKHRNRNVSVDDKGAMHDDNAIFASRVGTVTDDGRVIESNTLIGHDGRVDASGTIRDNSGSVVGELD